MKIPRVIAGAALVALVSGALPAGAQDVQYRKRTEISFEDDTISGDLTKPDGEYVEAKQRIRHRNLIRIRENFRDKILQSVGEL